MVNNIPIRSNKCDCTSVFNNLPNDIRSAESWPLFKNKNIKSVLNKAVARIIFLLRLLSAGYLSIVIFFNCWMENHYVDGNAKEIINRLLRMFKYLEKFEKIKYQKFKFFISITYIFIGQSLYSSLGFLLELKTPNTWVALLSH